jgi:5-methylcytosine-specific restriction endonuclease McrA
VQMSLVKTCSTCRVEKFRSEFHKNPTFRDGLAYVCKECACARSRRWRREGRKVWGPIPTEKPCSTCGEVKPLEDYDRHESTRDKRQTSCKACNRERTRKWRAANPDLYKEEKLKAADSQRRRVADDPEAYRARQRAMKASNPERTKEQRRKTYLKHADKAKVRAKSRRLKQKQVWTPEGDAWALVIQNDPCAYCGGRATGVDHIVPIDAGGWHVPDNLTACCMRCNSAKWNRPLWLFLARGALNR